MLELKNISFSVNDDSEKTEIIKDLDLKIEKNKLEFILLSLLYYQHYNTKKDN